MTPKQFKAWRDRMELTQAGAADALGLSKGTIELYERGQRPGADPRPVEIPKTVALACMALRAGIVGYVDEERFAEGIETGDIVR